MFKHKIAAALVAGALVTPTLSASAAVIGGFNIVSSADSLIASNGSFTTAGGSLATVLTDSNPGTYAFSFSPGAFVTLGFSSGIKNGAGNDFVLYELGVPDTFKVTLNGTTLSFPTVGTGSSAGVFALNAVPIDLASFGYSSGASISSVLIGLDTPGSTGTVPSLSLAGVLNAGMSGGVPEPATWAMMLLGFAGLGIAGYRTSRKSAVPTI